jgi:hypothetical protein
MIENQLFLIPNLEEPTRYYATSLKFDSGTFPFGGVAQISSAYPPLGEYFLPALKIKIRLTSLDKGHDLFRFQLIEFL